MARNYTIDPETLTVDQVDAQAISQWLRYRAYDPLLPASADFERKWAHENTVAWSNVTLPEGLSLNAAKALMASRAAMEARANPNHDNKGRFAAKGSVTHAEADTLAEKAIDDGGFTYNTVDKKAVTKGFAVSPYEERSKEIPRAEFGAESVYQYASANRDLLKQPDHNLGGWHDTENDSIWLDVSVVKSNQADAVKVAKDHNQKAIFNLETFEEIPTGGTGRSSRSLTPSEVTRDVAQGPTACPECQGNSDPANVPVHPGCHCDIHTVSVAMGVAEEEIHSLLARHADTGLDVVGEFELPDEAAVLPHSTTVFSGEDFRFGDLTEWVRASREVIKESIEEYTEELVAEYAAAFVDPDSEDSSSASLNVIIARVQSAVVGEGAATSFSLTKRLVKQRSQSSPSRIILFRLDAAPEDLATVYRLVLEGN